MLPHRTVHQSHSVHNNSTSPVPTYLTPPSLPTPGQDPTPTMHPTPLYLLPFLPFLTAKQTATVNTDPYTGYNESSSDWSLEFGSSLL